PFKMLQTASKKVAILAMLSHSYPDPAPGRVKLPVPRQVRMTKTPVSAMLARPTGIRNFQPSSMSWSTRIRGRVHPTHMIRKTNRYVFSSHQRKGGGNRSEEHTSELQSREKLVCRLL